MPRGSQYPQATLLPPEQVEAVLRIGVVGAADHVQVQVEARDPGSGELLAMWSIHHRQYHQLADAAAQGLAELLKIIAELTGPF